MSGSQTVRAPELSILNHPMKSGDLPSPLPIDESSDFAGEVELLHSAFERRVKESPDHVALSYLYEAGPSPVFRDLTYGELDALSNRIAIAIREHVKRHPLAGTETEQEPFVVPLFLGPSIQMYAAYFGCLKAGVTLCPLPLDAPDERLRDILDDFSPVIGLYSSAMGWMPHRINERHARTQWLDLDNLPDQTTKTTEWPLTSPHDIAYILYTSGSTGKPKGVQISHRSAACSISAHAQSAPLLPREVTRWFQFAAPTFDPSIMEIFLCLGSGATLCSAKRQLTLSDLNATVAASRATIMMATPSLAGLLDPQRIPTLKSLWTMGEALGPSVIDKFASDSKTSNGGGPHGLYNAYGPTEAAINCTLLKMMPDYRGTILGDALESCSLFIAREIPGRALEAVEAGMTGELIIGGPQVSSRGYLKRPNETDKAFTKHSEWGRVYRTGDRARIVWREDHHPYVEILGRLGGTSQRQVKINGQRVELSDVEASILKAVKRDDASRHVHALHALLAHGKQLVAVVICPDLSGVDSPREEVMQGALRAAANSALPPFARPSRFIIRKDELLSANGKLDSRGLIAFAEGVMENLPRALPNSTEPSEEGEDDATKFLLSALSRVLDARGSAQTRLSSNSSINAAGLDSLSAMKLLDLIRDHEVLRHLSLALLLNRTERTVTQVVDACKQDPARKEEGIAKMLSSFDARHREHCVHALGGVAVTSILPVTATQAGILASFLRRRSYVHHFLYHLASDIDVDRLSNSLKLVAGQHEALCSTFIPVDDELAPFAQCVLAQEVLSPDTHALLPSDLSPTLLYEKVNKEMQLEKPPVRFHWLKDAHTLVISLHHAIFDGGSLGLFLEDVERAYKGLSIAKRPGPAAASAEHLSAHLDAASTLQIEDFWKKELKGFESQPFADVAGRKPTASSRLGVCDATEIFTKADASGLQDISLEDLFEAARAYGSTPLAIVQLAWCLILNSYSESDSRDVAFGSVVSGRIESWARKCAAPTFATLPARLDLDATDSRGTIAGALDNLAAQAQRALSHSQIKLGSIVTQDGALPYDTLLALQLFEAEQEPFLGGEELPPPPMENDFAVMIEVWPGSAVRSLRLRATYKTSLLCPESSKLMLRQLHGLLQVICGRSKMVNACESSLSTLTSDLTNAVPSLAARCIGRQVEELQSDNAFLHAGFEEQAQAHPDRPALIFNQQAGPDSQEVVTYRELDALANFWARRLISANSGKRLVDQAVPLYAVKSIDLYVGLLAILKAGGAWCPIDPALPVARKVNLVLRCASPIVVVAGEVPEDLRFEQLMKNREVANLIKHVVTCDGHVGRGEATGQSLSSAGSPVPRAHGARSPRQLAYLIWTSGSTGEPKGVLIEHLAASMAMRSLQASIPHGADPPRTLQFSAFTFDVFVQDLFYTWGLGGCVVAAPQGVMIDSLARLASDCQATHAHLTPAYAACVPREECPTLRYVTMIGEKLSEEVALDWSAGGKIYAFNTYGPAENTVVSTWRRFTPDDAMKAQNVGFPLPNTSCLVLRDDGLPALLGGTGELALGGVQVARGYLKDEARTRTKYPTTKQDGRIYHTGDMVRMLHDGSIDFIGRQDDLVKLGGIRVELSEISHALRECHPVVKQIETMLLASGEENQAAKVIVSFLACPSLGESKTSTSVQDAVRSAAKSQVAKHLPDYMHPAHYILVPDIPRSASAKTDRKGLAAVFAKHLARAVIESERHQTSQMEQIDLEEPALTAAQCLAQVVGSSTLPKDISRLANATSLRASGLDSIRTIRLAVKLRSAGLQSPPAVELMRLRTFAQLVALVARVNGLMNQNQKLAPAKGDAEGFDAAAEHKRALDRFSDKWKPSAEATLVEQLRDVTLSGQEPLLRNLLPCTHLQQSLLLQTQKEVQAYWGSTAIKLDRTEAASVKQACLAIASRIDVLRTTFLPTALLGSSDADLSGGFVQAVLSPSAFNLDWTCCTTNSDAELARLVNERLESVSRARHPFFAGKPGWAVTLISGADSTTYLLFTMHHALYDKQSMELILSSLASELEASKAPVSSPSLRETLAHLPRSSIWALSDNELGHWRQLCDRYASHCLPWSLPDLTGSARRAHRRAPRMYHVASPLQQTAAMDLVAARADLPSVAAIIQAAYGAVLAHYLDQATSLIGTTVSERVHAAQLDSAIAPLIATVPFFVESSGKIDEALASLSSQWRNSLTNRHISATSVRKLLSWPADQPLYAGVFVVQVESDGKLQAAKVQEHDLTNAGALQVEHALALNVYTSESGKIKRMVLSASADTLSAEHLDVMLQQILGLMKAMCAASAGADMRALISALPTSSLSIQHLSPAARSSQSTLAKAPRTHPCFWISHYAKTQPNWIAAEQVVGPLDRVTVTDASQKDPSVLRWTYKMLDQLSDSYASALLERLGTASGRVIGLCMGRTLEAFAAVLAIFKLDAIYLPIAEDLPGERKLTLLQDSQAACIFTSDGLLDGVVDGARSDAWVIDVDGVEWRTVSAGPARAVDLSDEGGKGGYLLYTSGSTGKPKGVLVSSANLSAYVEGFYAVLKFYSKRSCDLAGKGKYLNLASRAFDPHLSQMFMAWRLGYAATTGPRADLLEDLSQTVTRLQITHIGMLPSLLEQAGLTPESAPSLAVVSVGGEKITPYVLDKWGRESGTGEVDGQQALVLNLYGPTEVTIGCTMACVSRDSSPRNIGYPVGNASVVVLVPGTSHIAARGEQGELVLLGDLVALGYHHRPDQGGFVILTLPDSSKHRAYRTGDMVRMLADGTIDFLGRTDEQIKIRGQRLELGEVSETVRRCASALGYFVQAAATYIKHPSLPAPRLWVHLCVDREAQCSQKEPIEMVNHGSHSQLVTWVHVELAWSLRNELPSYMVPTPIVYRRMPRLPSGKVDIKRANAHLCQSPIGRLLEPLGPPDTKAQQQQSASDDLSYEESRVVDMIASVMGSSPHAGAAKVTGNSSVFELGIDSLSALGLSLKLRQELHLDASVAAVFLAETVSGLAALPPLALTESRTVEHQQLQREQAFNGAAEKYVLDRIGGRNGEALHASSITSVRRSMPLQEALVALTMMARDAGDPNLPYITHHAYSMHGGDESADIEHFVEAWRQVITDSDVLRTCFMDGPEANVVQVILKPSTELLSRLVVFRNADDGVPWSCSEAAASICSSMASAPPIRVGIDRATRRVHLAIHHSLYDGHTLPIVHRRVETIAVKLSRGQQVDNKTSLVASVFEARALAIVAKANEPSAVAFWRAHLSGVRYASRSALYSSLGPVPASAQTNSECRRVELDLSSLLAALQDRAVREHKTTLAVLLQAALAMTLAYHQRDRDVVFGTVLSGRGPIADEDGGSLLPCVTTIPSRFDLREARSVKQVVEIAKRSVLRTWPYQHTALRRIQTAIAAPRRLFETLFAFEQHPVRSPPQDAELRLHADESASAIDYPVAINVVQSGDSQLTAVLAFKPHELRDGMHHALCLAESFSHILSVVADGGEQPTLEELGLCSSPAVPDETRPEDAPDAHSDAGWNALELKAREVLAALLNIEPSIVRHTDPFYRLGLDSILAIRFARELRAVEIRKSPVQIVQAGSLRTLFSERSPEMTSTKNSVQARSAAVSSLPQLRSTTPSGSTAIESKLKGLFVPLHETDKAEAIYPCTPLQSGMLTLSSGTAQSGYRQVHALRLRSDINLDKLRDAWASVVETNDILRTTFHLDDSEDSQWLAIVHKHAPIVWNHGPGSTAPTALGNTPPVGVTVEEGVARFALHHAVYDGVSLPLMFAQLRDAYANGNHLPARKPFHAVARALTANRIEDEEYWCNKLSGFKGISPRPSNPEKKRTRASCFLDIPGQSVRTACKELGVTLQAVCMLANAMMLASSYVGHRDVSFAHVMACRQLSIEEEAVADEEEVIGPLFNTIVRRIRILPLLASCSEIVASVQRELDESMPHQGASLANVQKRWRKSSKPELRHRLLDSLFVFHKAINPARSASHDKAPLWRAQDEDTLAGSEEEYPLNVSIVEREDGTAEVLANSNVLDPRKVVDQIASCARMILLQPHCRAVTVLRGLEKTPIGPVAATSSIDGGAPTRPLSPEESTLKQAVEKVLNLSVEQSGAQLASANADVLAAGIDSINAIKLARLCRASGLVHVSVPVILRGQTLAEIIALSHASQAPRATISAKQPTSLDSAQRKAITALPLSEADVEAVLPCLPGQLHHLEAWLATGRRFYEAPWVFDCSSKVEPDRLASALERLRADYTTLRTCFIGVGGTAQQVIVKAGRAPTVLRVVSTSDDDRDRFFAQEVLRCNSMSFDLRSPPVQVVLIQSETKSLLILKMHHAIYDAWCVSRMFADLQALYNRSSIEPRAPFSQYVDKLCDTDDTRIQQQQSFWDSDLTAAQATIVPSQGACLGQTARGPNLLVRVPDAVHDVGNLEAQCVNAGTSLRYVVMHSLARVLGEICSVSVPTFGFYTAARSAEEDLDQVAGPLLNVLPVAINTSISVRISLQQVHRSLTARRSHEQSSLSDVLDRKGLTQPLFNCWLNLLWHDQADEGTPGIQATDSDTNALVLTHKKLPEAAAYFDDKRDMKAVQSSETSLGSHLTSRHRSPHNVYVDVRRTASNTLGFGVRLDVALMDSDSAVGFVREVAAHVSRTVQEELHI
ncbi:nonribosomal siderophore peptide synthase [Ceraceosorus bombacis]|uniref:Nonribosomal siderophore peptide synthase n=1 Tax=Ceraceosorus bombacis TaxID=401625 RepID=A0A0P1BTX7_9BASI|nr:nonribosomal siderophore peptide synthase [Ceraceosorus bombacis]